MKGRETIRTDRRQLALLAALGLVFAGLAAADGSRPRIRSFRVTPVTEGDQGAAGNWVELSWVTEGADSVRLYKDDREMKGRVQLSMKSGLRTRLTKPAVFKLVAENAEGQVSKAVEAGPAAGPGDGPRILSFEAEPRTLTPGQTVRFHWQIENAGQVQLLDDRGPLESRIELPSGKLGWPLSMNGALQESPEKTTTYTLLAASKTGKTSKSLEVTVTTATETTDDGPKDGEPTCRVTVSIHGKYGHATDAVGVFRARGSGLGDFLFERPVTTVRDHRKKPEPAAYQRSIITLPPGEYMLVPSGGGSDSFGSFGVIYKPGRSRFSCENGNSGRVSIRADHAEY